MRGNCSVYRPTKIIFSLRHSISRGLAHKTQLDHHANQQKRSLRHQTKAASVVERSVKATDRMVSLFARLSKFATCNTNSAANIFHLQLGRYMNQPNMHNVNS